MRQENLINKSGEPSHHTIGRRRSFGVRLSEGAFFISQFSVSGLLVGETIRSAVVEKNYGQAAELGVLAAGSMINNVWTLRKVRRL